MKPLFLAIAFSCAIPVYLAAQCDTYLSIETLIKIKKDFDEAEDLLISCFTKTKEAEIVYDDGSSGKYVSYDSKKRVKFGQDCTFPRESVSIYYYTGNLICEMGNSTQYLKIKNLVKTQGKKTLASLDNAVAYLHKGFTWEFKTVIHDKCSANYYQIMIRNP